MSYEYGNNNLHMSEMNMDDRPFTKLDHSETLSVRLLLYS